MEEANYLGDYGIKTKMESVVGQPDPAQDQTDMVDDEKPEKWSSVCLHFSQNTTFHGVNKITDETPFVIRRIIWMFIVLGGLTLFLIQMIQSVLLYLEYPVTVNNKIIYNKTIRFPAVTICNQNAFRISRAVTHGHYFLIDRLYEHPLQQMNLTEIYENCPNASETTLKMVLDDAAHDKTDMIVTCVWDGMQCSADDFLTSITDHGVCYTFNSGQNSSIKTARRTGSKGGLRLRLNIEQYEYMRGPNSAAGVKILVHDPTEIPLVRDFGQAVSPGSHAFVGVQMTQINNLKEPHGECQWAMPLEFFGDYNIPNCQVDCLANFLRARCGCRMNHMPDLYHHPGKPRYCTLGTWEHCVTQQLKLFEVVQKGSNKCNCPVPCERRKYETDISYGTMSNYDTDMQGRSHNNDEIRKSFVAALETTQRADSYLAAKDLSDVQQLNIHASSIGGIFNQISEKMHNITCSVDDIFYELTNRTSFHQEYGFSVVQQALQYGFLQAWDIHQQHVFVPLVSGVKQLLHRYEKAMFKLINESSTSHTFRDVVALMQNEQLDTRLDMALQAQDNIENIFNSILEGKSILEYPWGIANRYRQYMVPTGLLRHNVPYLNLIFDFVAEKINITINLTKELRHMLIEAHHKREWNITHFNEIRKDYLNGIDSLSRSHSVFRTAVFGKMEALLDAEMSGFTKLVETMWKEYRNVRITILNVNQLAKTMNENIWPDIMDTVNLSVQYTHHVNINKTIIAKSVTSEVIDEHLKQMANIVVDVRARAHNLGRDWGKFQDAQINVWSAIRKQNYTHQFYSKLNTDFQEILKDPDSNISQQLLQPFREELNNNNPDILYKWTNADIPQKNEEQLIDLIMMKFEIIINDLGILSAINEKDDRFFEAFDIWAQSLKKFIMDCKMDDKFFKENFLEIDVYMTELSYQLVEQREAYDLTNLWSDIGGSMGLFVGASVITMFELFDAMLHNFFKVWRRKIKQ